jgi:hypothetical protein
MKNFIMTKVYKLIDVMLKKFIQNISYEKIQSTCLKHGNLFLNLNLCNEFFKLIYLKITL